MCLIITIQKSIFPQSALQQALFFKNMKAFLLKKSAQIAEFATLRNTFFVFLAWVLCQVILGWFTAKMQAQVPGISVLDLGFGYSAEAAYSDYLDKYTDIVRTLCLQAECVDLVYPCVYGLFFACLTTLVWKNTRFEYLNVVPFFATFFDYFENIGVFTLLLSLPSKLLLVASMTSVFGLIKWSFATVSTLAFLVGLVLKLVKMIKK